MRVDLPDPEHCPTCGTRSRIVDSRLSIQGYRRRRHACACGRRWSTWQTVIDPRRLRPKARPHHNL